MKQKVLAAIEQYGMFQDEKRVTVAISGGADSVTLLYCLLEIQDELGLTVSAAHLNHNIRGNEAIRDQDFVKRLCDRLNVPLIIKSVDVPASAKENNESIELAARRVRYKFLEEASKGKIAVAHNSNDNLETMIFNLARGSAISGLIGIPATRGRIVRPLIFCSRKEIEDFCNLKGIEYVNDSTNISDDYMRNNIRHNIVPVLKQINQSIERSASRTAEFLRRDNDCLNDISALAYNVAVTDDGINTQKLSAYHSAIRSRVLKKYYAEHFGRELESSHILMLENLLQKPGVVILPCRIEAKTTNGCIIMEKSGEMKKTAFKTEILKENIKNVNKLLFKNLIDCDKIVGEVIIRSRAPGDKVRLAGHGISKTLKNLYNEYSIPLCDREHLPVACDDSGIVWIFGIGVADRVKTDESTKKVILFNSERQTVFGGE